MPDLIKVIVVRVGQPPRTELIENTLESFQSVVGGNIEIVRFSDFLMVCNEDGKFQGLTPNFRLPHDIICGDVLFCGDNSPDFGSLEPEQIRLLKSYFVRRL